jgi:hypothetical protein
MYYLFFIKYYVTDGLVPLLIKSAGNFKMGATLRVLRLFTGCHGDSNQTMVEMSIFQNLEW